MEVKICATTISHAHKVMHYCYHFVRFNVDVFKKHKQTSKLNFLMYGGFLSNCLSAIMLIIQHAANERIRLEELCQKVHRILF